jgi:cation:H+ antiporter
MINHWLQFTICAAVIVFAGSKLTRNAAIVADNTGIGSAWVGALMLPLATSLPELVTTLRAVAIDAPDLALGNILGSCLYNLALLAVIDILEGRGPLTSRINKGHTIIASLSIVTICIAALAIQGVFHASFGWIGFETILIALVYIFGGRMIYRFEQKNLPQLKPGGVEHEIKSVIESATTVSALLNFSLAAGLIIIAGVFLTDASDRIAIETGLGQTFVGSIFLAISTSLPETVTTITAVRLGYLDMAVANIFGANFMNLFIIFIADLLYLQEPLLQAVSGQQLISALMVILMSIIIIFGLTYRSEKRFVRAGYDTLLVLACYLTAFYLLYKSGGN